LQNNHDPLENSILCRIKLMTAVIHDQPEVLNNSDPNGSVAKAIPIAADAPATTIISTNPATGQKLAEFATTPVDQLPVLMEKARNAQPAWEKLGFNQRIAIVRKIVNLLYQNSEKLIHILMTEQGKPEFEAYIEFWPAIELTALYSRIVKKVAKPERIFVPMLPHRQHWVEHKPFGVVAVIAPWNFPVMLSLPPIIAALITGNTVIYKPSEFSSQVGAFLNDILHQAGIPNDVFQTVYGMGDVGAALVKAKPDKLVFTGSPNTARKISAAAAVNLTPMTMELGGKDAAIVLEDADLDRTAMALVWAGMLNAGQACLSVERLYVRREVAEPLVQKMAAIMDDHVRLAAHHDQPTMGPIITSAQLNIIDSHIKEAVEQGARVIAGGRVAEDSSGRFYLPTLITDVKPEMRVIHEETFGPVIAVVPVDTDEQAVQVANDSQFGLTGSVWTRNRARGIALAQQMRVGHASINDHIISSSTPQVPWGGIKDSGYGRTRGREGLLDMMFIQAVSIERFAPLPREIFWYPYTQLKVNLIRRVLGFLYAATWGEKLSALLGRKRGSQV
jgi:acyl-CoA reductase-like NAD-dependent aldehyde dehydrogenase